MTPEEQDILSIVESHVDGLTEYHLKLITFGRRISREKNPLALKYMRHEISDAIRELKDQKLIVKKSGKWYITDAGRKAGDTGSGEPMGSVLTFVMSLYILM